ncbi:MAG: hypothetical protein K2K25_06690 [Muribaculaceae bacterium]|nr:hypothetical protein [Muribaculaceae bacterium]
MKRKTYEVRGMMEWHPIFTVGRTRLRVPFTGGYLSDGAVTPATFETSDAVVQTVIEQSDAFRSKRIRLRCEVELPAPSSQKIIPKSAEVAATLSKVSSSQSETEPLKVIESDSWELAADRLQYDYGVAIECLKDEASCQAAARKLGIELKY